MSLVKNLHTFYSEFKVSERILLSGHSHQAWPDVAKDGIIECFTDAATHIDNKWSLAFDKAQRVRQFYCDVMNDPNGQIALGQSTHELLLRFLSDLDCFKHKKSSPVKIVTTDGEFHAMRRQLDRLKDLNINIEVVATEPSHSLAERLIDKLDKDTDAVMVSAVFFATSKIFKQVGEVAKAAEQKGIPCLVDSYHSINVIDFDIEKWGLKSAFIVGGGYKYCQAGEGNCFLRIPPNYHGSPIITGWFAEFETLDQPPGQVSYGKGQAAFAGSTYDPVSHYRAAAVFDFFAKQSLTADVLSAINKQQISQLWQGIEALDLDREILALPKHGIEENAGFLSLTTPNASQWVKKLAQHGIQTDSRGDQLRLGPAPYVSDEQLDEALSVIGSIAQSI